MGKGLEVKIRKFNLWTSSRALALLYLLRDREIESSSNLDRLIYFARTGEGMVRFVDLEVPSWNDQDIYIFFKAKTLRYRTTFEQEKNISSVKRPVNIHNHFVSHQLDQRLR
jgi:hypothetical protein